MIAAAVQLTSTEDRARNLREAMRWIDEAHRRGAGFVALPENVDLMGSEEAKIAGAEAVDGPTFQAFAARAKALGIWVLAGTLAERASPGRIFNTSVLYDPEGAAAAVYRKVHLFDVDLADGVRYRESRVVESGRELVVAEAGFGRVGLSICYDLRFPELFRALAQKGAEILAVPSAFTLHTGKDHWEVLLRARAIENTAYVIAPAQVGRHGAGRTTYGNAMIVDPWGAVIARCSDGPGICLAELSPEVLLRVRRELPSLGHRRVGVSGSFSDTDRG
ncbi:Aliphatic amidase AmiE [Vulgatibacter incomptus]|uniref:Aliphatic amidase AmiE n=1 Tax=Vulgatibacter incomptus TaxID=1391653 RepID=A0A0K1PIC1_9BACT|nr:Aliphatic amidase AmiE [Vulgatibacter incomptus]